MSTAPTIQPKVWPRLTAEQYLTLERSSRDRHAFVDGLVVAMAGESLEHGIISVNLVNIFATQLKGSPCFALSKDTKVRSGPGLLSTESTKVMFSYPDVLIVCGQPEFLDEKRDVLLNPTVIVEVLSPSTEAFERGEKFQRYRTWNSSLTDYVLVSQSKAHIEHFRRQDDGTWNLHEAVGLDATLAIPSVRCLLQLADVYDRIAFPRE